MSPRPKCVEPEEDELLDEEQVEEWLFRMSRVFQGDVPTITQLKAIGFIYAYEATGSRKKALEALGINDATAWRWMRKTGLHEYMGKRRHHHQE